MFKKTFSLVAISLGVPSVAWAHGAQIQADVLNGQIVVRGISQDTEYGSAAFDVRKPLTPVHLFDLANAAGTWTKNGPGFVVYRGPIATTPPFATSTDLGLLSVGELRVWNDSTGAFEDPGAEEMRFSGSAFTTFNTGPSVAGGDIINNLSGGEGSHSTVRYTLLGDGATGVGGDDGIYLTTLKLYNSVADEFAGSPTPTLAADSDLFYILLSKNVSDTGVRQRAFDAATALVPEPGTAGVLALSGLLALRRRRIQR